MTRILDVSGSSGHGGGYWYPAFQGRGGELKGERERESGMVDVPDIGTTG